MDASLNGTANDEADPDATIESRVTSGTGVTVNVTTLAGFADPVAVPVAETLDFLALAVAAEGIDETTLEARVEPIQVVIDPTVP